MDKKDLLARISSANGTDDFFTLCKDIYLLLVEQPSEKRSETLAWFFQAAEEHYFAKKGKNPPSDDLSERLKSYACKYRQLVHGLVGAFSLGGYAENLYYGKLWDGIEALLSDATEEEKGYCYYTIACNNLTPYYNLPIGLKVSRNRFGEIIVNIQPSIRKLEFAIRLSRNQTTELTSRVLHLLEDLDDLEQKSVLLVYLLKLWGDKVIEDSKKSSDIAQTARAQSETSKTVSVNEIETFQIASSQNESEAIEAIAEFQYPSLNGDEYSFALIKSGEVVYLTDQGKTLEQLDRIFDLKEPVVIKYLVAILKQYGAIKKGDEIIFEIKNWNGNISEDENEDLKRGKLSLFSCVSFMLNMKIFYV